MGAGHRANTPKATILFAELSRLGYCAMMGPAGLLTVRQVMAGCLCFSLAGGCNLLFRINTFFAAGFGLLFAIDPLPIGMFDLSKHM